MYAKRCTYAYCNRIVGCAPLSCFGSATFNIPEAVHVPAVTSMIAQYIFRSSYLTVCRTIAATFPVIPEKLYAVTAMHCGRSGRFPQRCVDVSWSLGVTSYGRSNLSKVQEQTIAGGPVDDFLSTSLEGRRYDMPVISRSNHDTAADSVYISASGRDGPAGLRLFEDTSIQLRDAFSPSSTWHCV